MESAMPHSKGRVLKLSDSEHQRLLREKQAERQRRRLLQVREQEKVFAQQQKAKYKKLLQQKNAEVEAKLHQVWKAQHAKAEEALQRKLNGYTLALGHSHTGANNFESDFKEEAKQQNTVLQDYSKRATDRGQAARDTIAAKLARAEHHRNQRAQWRQKAKQRVKDFQLKQAKSAARRRELLPEVLTVPYEFLNQPSSVRVIRLDHNSHEPDVSAYQAASNQRHKDFRGKQLGRVQEKANQERVEERSRRAEEKARLEKEAQDLHEALDALDKVDRQRKLTLSLERQNQRQTDDKKKRLNEWKFEQSFLSDAREASIPELLSFFTGTSQPVMAQPDTLDSSGEAQHNKNDETEGLNQTEEEADLFNASVRHQGHLDARGSQSAAHAEDDSMANSQSRTDEPGQEQPQHTRGPNDNVDTIIRVSKPDSLPPGLSMQAGMDTGSTPRSPGHSSKHAPLMRNEDVSAKPVLQRPASPRVEAPVITDVEDGSSDDGQSLLPQPPPRPMQRPIKTTRSSSPRHSQDSPASPVFHRHRSASPRAHDAAIHKASPSPDAHGVEGVIDPPSPPRHSPEAELDRSQEAALPTNTELSNNQSRQQPNVVPAANPPALSEKETSDANEAGRSEALELPQSDPRPALSTTESNKDSVEQLPPDIDTVSLSKPVDSESEPEIVDHDQLVAQFEELNTLMDTIADFQWDTFPNPNPTPALEAESNDSNSHQPQMSIHEILKGFVDPEAGTVATDTASEDRLVPTAVPTSVPEVNEAVSEPTEHMMEEKYPDDDAVVEHEPEPKPEPPPRGLSYYFSGYDSVLDQGSSAGPGARSEQNTNTDVISDVKPLQVDPLTKYFATEYASLLDESNAQRGNHDRTWGQTSFGAYLTDYKSPLDDQPVLTQETTNQQQSESPPQRSPRQPAPPAETSKDYPSPQPQLEVQTSQPLVDRIAADIASSILHGVSHGPGQYGSTLTTDTGELDVIVSLHSDSEGPSNVSVDVAPTKSVPTKQSFTSDFSITQTEQALSTHEAEADSSGDVKAMLFTNDTDHSQQKTPTLQDMFKSRRAKAAKAIEERQRRMQTLKAERANTSSKPVAQRQPSRGYTQRRPGRTASNRARPPSAVKKATPSQQRPVPPKLSSDFGTKRKVDLVEMKERSRRNYNKLPEVCRRREEQKKKELIKQRMEKIKRYNKVRNKRPKPRRKLKPST